VDIQRRPNVVYILADDMGYGDVSCLNPGCAFQTPHVDALAASGMAFTDAHAASAVCTPSRYAILTGRYPWRSELKEGVLNGYSAPLIEQGRPTVASMLRQQGYQTAVVGKWHLGMGMPFADAVDAPCEHAWDSNPNVDYTQPVSPSPNDYGFDQSFCIAASLDMPPYVYIENGRFTQTPDRMTKNTGKGFWREGPTAPDFRHEDVLPTFTQNALDLIDSFGQEPFFLYFPLPAPHTPILPSARFQGASGTNAYGDFVLMCDDVVGQIRAKLADNGLLDNTIVIFASDNGCSPMADFEELMAAGHNPNYIFRGHKADIYEGGHRIPLLVSWPNMIQPGTVCHKLVSLSDLYATLADILGASVPMNAAEDSVSNLPLWRCPDADAVRSSAIQESIDGSLTIRQGHWKLAMCPGSGGWSYPCPGVDNTEGLPSFQLFNMEKDIGERTNMVQAEPDIAAALRAELTQQILRGRSTPGRDQPNNGAPIWEAVKWLEDADSVSW
jgi:arylsulfatase A